MGHRPGHLWADLSAGLTAEQRADVVALYGQVFAHNDVTPSAALTRVHGILAVRCVAALQFGLLDEAKVAAAQCAYEMDLQQRLALTGSLPSELAELTKETACRT